MTSFFRLPLFLLPVLGILNASADDPIYLDGNILQYGTLSQFLSPIVLGPKGGTIPFSGKIDFTGIISGSGPLTLDQYAGSYASPTNATATLSGRNTFSGGLNIHNSSYDNYYTRYWLVRANSPEALGTGPVSLSGGSALSISSQPTSLGTNRITLVRDSALILDSLDIDPAAVISRTSSQGVLEISGASNRFRYGRSLNMALYGDGTLFLGAAFGEVTYYASVLKPGAGNVYRLGGSLPLPGTNYAQPNTLVIGGRDNILTGTASVQIAGMVKLMNANNLTGGISGSGVGIGHDAALGSGPVSVLGLTALNGPRTIANALFLKDGSTYALTGPLIFTGPVDLGGGTPVLYNPGPSQTSVRFTNRIGNGVLQVNYGPICQLDGANTFSALNLENASRVVVSSEANLGGPLAPIHFIGYDSYSPGTLETTASFTLHNPISIGTVYDPQSAGLDVAAGTTLTLDQVIPGSGNISKTGEGTLDFSSRTPFGGALSVEEGQVSTIGKSATFGSVYVYEGATFAGAGDMLNLFIEGGTVAPGGGTGMISIQCPTFLPSEKPGQLQFEFTRKGSPIYTTPANCRNGLLLLPPGLTGLLGAPEDCEISIFFATSTMEPGDVFRGAFAQQYFSGRPAVTPAITSRFSYYVPSSTGTISFHGKTYAPLDLTKYNVERSWHEDPAIPSFAGEPKPPFYVPGYAAGLVCQFKVVAGRILILSLPPPNGSVGHAYDFSYEASGLPAATFAVTSGKLPPGLTLSAEGNLSGTPTAGGIYNGTVTASNGLLPLAKQTFSITIAQSPTILGDPLTISIPANEPYTYTYQATGTPAPTFRILSGQSPGLPLSSTGVMSGTPYYKGTYTGIVTASNEAGEFSQSFSITVTDRLNKPPAFISSVLPNAQLRLPYSFQLQAFGVPPPTFAVTAGTLPSGLTLSPAGLISGRAAKAGIFPISITASNGTAPDAVLAVSLEVARKPQTITFPSVGQLKVGDVIPFEAKASTSLPVTYSISGPATLANNILTCIQAGKIRIRAQQAGDATYAPITNYFQATIQ